MKRALERALVPHDVTEYPDAEHSFIDNKGFFLKILRFTGIGYNDPATQDARRRIAAFFHTPWGLGTELLNQMLAGGLEYGVFSGK